MLPILYSALTEKTALLAPLSGSLDFKIYPKMPYDSEVRQLLDFVSISICRAAQLLDYPRIRESIVEFLQGRRAHTDFPVAVGESVVSGKDSWIFENLFPQVFGRAKKLSRKVKRVDTGEPDLSREMAHLMRLATSGHQGHVLEQLLMPDFEGIPDDGRQFLWQIDDAALVGEECLLESQLRLEAFQSVLNADTYGRIAGTIASLKTEIEANGIPLKYVDIQDEINLGFCLHEAIVQICADVGKVSRCVTECTLEKIPISYEEWSSQVIAEARRRTSDPLLVKKMWSDIFVWLDYYISGCPVAQRAEFHETSFILTFIWDGGERSMPRPCECSVPQRSPESLLGVDVTIFGSCGTDPWGMDPYTKAARPIPSKIVPFLKDGVLAVQLNVDAVNQKG